MIKKNLLALFVLFIISYTYSQDYNFNSSSIPENLKENANAVILFDDVTVEIRSQKSMVFKVKKAITILNKLGDKYKYVTVSFDKSRKIKNIKTIIYNSFGTEIKKVKRKEYRDVSMVDGGTLYADNRMLYYEHVPIGYPYTIYYEYEVESPNTAFLNSWKPIKSFATGVLSSSYKIIYPENISIQLKEDNLKDYPIEILKSENETSYSIKLVEPIRYEPLSPKLSKLMPRVQPVLNKFYAQGILGEAKNWKQLGKWEYDNFYKDVGELSETVKRNIIKLVDGVNNPIEKAKIVYQFVQNKTRYISVQVGIGGLKPMLANDVDRLGYGDCKALTNYTKSLLEAVGVKSYFTELYGGYEKLNMDFESPNIQGNHVILNIPNGESDIWLECTNQKIPFGYIANFTDDRDVIVIKPEGGEIKHTKKYTAEENLQFTKGKYAIDAQGAINAVIKIESSGTQYDDNLNDCEGENQKNLKILFKNKFSNINNIKFLKIEVANVKNKIRYDEDLEFEATSYATLSGNQMFITTNAFNKSSYVPKRVRNRKLPFEISRGYVDLDEVEIQIPANYDIEYLPKKVELASKFGVYAIEFTKVDEFSYLYKRKLQINEGSYEREAYEEYRKFRKSVRKYDNSKIILIKK